MRSALPVRFSRPHAVVLAVSAVVALGLPLLTASGGSLPEPPDLLQFSTDIDLDLFPADQTPVNATDEDIIQAGNAFTIVGLGSFPAEDTDLDGYHNRLPTGAAGPARLYSFDTVVALPFGGFAHPGDVVIEVDAGMQYGILFPHAVVGLPDSVNVDAIAEIARVGEDNGLLLSFDTTVTILPGTQAEFVAQDEDIVLFSGFQNAQLFFDGSAFDVDEALDLDALDVLPDGRLAISFDASGSVPALAAPAAARRGVPAPDVFFDDEDILIFDPVQFTWAMEWDGDANLPGLGPADLDALSAAFFAVPPTPTDTATSTATQTPTNTATRTSTQTPTNTAPDTVTPGGPSLTPTNTPTETPTPTNTSTPIVSSCVGDCDDDGAVSISELIRGVNIAVELLPLAECPSFDVDGDQLVSISELVTAVNGALGPCG